MNNQDAKADAGKLELSLVPTEIIRDIATIRMYGNRKYPKGGKDNWKQVEKQRYIDAMYRHWLAYVDDNNAIDEESGYPALWHCACNIAFLCEMEKEKEKEKEKENINIICAKPNSPIVINRDELARREGKVNRHEND